MRNASNREKGVMDHENGLCEKGGQDLIWDHFQNEGSGYFVNSLARLKYLASYLRPGWRILNIGVGDGTLERLALSKGCDVFCLDPSARAVERLRSELKLGEKARVGYSQRLPFEDDEFDAVVMSEVLEHLSEEELQRTLKECLRVLCVGGLFIGTVPADERLFENHVVCPSCGHIFHRWGHAQEFSEQRLRGLLGRCFGNCVVKRKFFGNWQDLNWKGKLGFVLKVVSLRLGLKGGGETFVFWSRKRTWIS